MSEIQEVVADEPGRGLVTSDVAEMTAQLREASKDNAELRADLDREKKKTNTLRAELEESRIRAGKLERQLAGYDEDEFDPQKQRGVGAIPVGGPGDLIDEVEAIEERLGMAPTLDRQLRQLGLAGVEKQLVAASDDEQLPRVVQLLWYARTVLSDLEGATSDKRCSSIVAMIDDLPISFVEAHLDLESWDDDGLPPLRTT